MSKVCLCLTGKTLAANLEVLNKYRKWVDIAELRVDYLNMDERLQIRRFPELAGIPTILTVRRKSDGGRFIEGEGARIVLLASGLAFADTEKRRNFAYVDLEEDLDVPSLEEAARTFGTRIIRSFHDFTGVPADLSRRIRSLVRNGDEIAKVAAMARGMADVAKVFHSCDETRDIEKIVLAMGPYGVCTRILAEKAGSVLSYTSPRGEHDFDCAGPGQLDPVELVETYRFRSLNANSRIFGIVGSPLEATSSPMIHNPAFTRCDIDAVYLPFKTDTLSGFFELAGELKIQGVSVTIPYKESIVPYLGDRSDQVIKIGSCNTAVKKGSVWHGYNTDAEGFSSSLLNAMDRMHLKRKRIGIIGAGGVACAVAAEVHRLGGHACILNRNEARAKALAEKYKFAWGALDGRGIELLDHFNEIIIQTTSVGMEPDVDADPIELYRFRGREMVMDLIYKPAKTRMLQRATAAGCRVLNGRDMLERQAYLQFKLFTGHDFPI